MVLRDRPRYPRRMADIFDVIADATRRDILRLLNERDQTSIDGTSVSQIVQELGVSQPTVSKHLKVLREAALVAVREEGQHRFYTLDARPLEEVDDWLVPFLFDEADAEAIALAASTTLPEPAVQAADAVGRAAAAAKHALSSVFNIRPPR